MTKIVVVHYLRATNTSVLCVCFSVYYFFLTERYIMIITSTLNVVVYYNNYYTEGKFMENN